MLPQRLLDLALARWGSAAINCFAREWWQENTKTEGSQNGSVGGSESTARIGRAHRLHRPRPGQGTGLSSQKNNVKIQHTIRLEPQTFLLPWLQGADYSRSERASQDDPREDAHHDLQRMRLC